MNARPEGIARDKEILIARSALCRLHLRRDAYVMRDSLRWRRVALSAATAPAVSTLFLGLGISVVGFDRAARAVTLAGRALLFAKLACVLVGFWNRARNPPHS